MEADGRTISFPMVNSTIDNSLGDETTLCCICCDIFTGFCCGIQVCDTCKQHRIRRFETEPQKMKFSNGEISHKTRSKPSIVDHGRCPPCKVCGAEPSGHNYGTLTCKACATFFHRSVSIEKRSCVSNEQCVITATTRNVCKHCRYKKCIRMGMNIHTLKRRVQPSVKGEETKYMTSVLEKAYKCLECINNRSTKLAVQLTLASEKHELWKAIMTQFYQCAVGTLLFAKQVPGFRTMPMETQISVCKVRMYSIVLAVLSTKYCLESSSYNYFNMEPIEELAVLTTFPGFSGLLPAFHSIGQAFQKLAVDSTEVAYLCALSVIPDDELELQERLVSGLQQYCSSKSTRSLCDGNRCNLVLMRLPGLFRASEMHSKIIMDLISDEENADLEIPKFFYETYLDD